MEIEWKETLRDARKDAENDRGRDGERNACVCVCVLREMERGTKGEKR